MEIKDIRFDNGNAFDWGKTSSDYARFRDIYPKEFYQKILDLGYCQKGQNVLDLGTGTGVLPRSLYPYGADFVGVDISENQIHYAKALSNEAGMDIKYFVSSAEAFAFAPSTFDVVTACQCFMYFDKSILLPKIHRLLKENGHLLIMYMNWLPDESPIAQTSENLILKYNPAWTGFGMQRQEPKTPEWSKALFTVSNALAFDVNIRFTRETWNGRIKACRGIGASSLTSKEIEAFEKEHLAYLNTVPKAFTIPHYITILDLKKKLS